MAGNEISVEELEKALIEPIQPTELSHLDGLKQDYVTSGGLHHVVLALLCRQEFAMNRNTKKVQGVEEHVHKPLEKIYCRI